jgi:hypothetical protein
VSSNVAKTYNFVIASQGTDKAAIQHLFLVSFTSTPGSGFSFSISNTSGSESVKAGETATYKLVVAPSSGTFPSNVALAFTGCPPISTCSLSQTSVGAGNSATTLSFTVQTAAAVIAGGRPTLSRIQVLYAAWFWFPGLIFGICGGLREASRSKKLALWMLFTLLLLLLIVACGGGLQGGGTASAQPGTPAGTYNMTVSATMSAAPGSPTKTADITLTVN